MLCQVRCGGCGKSVGQVRCGESGGCVGRVRCGGCGRCAYVYVHTFVHTYCTRSVQVREEHSAKQLVLRMVVFVSI